MSCFTPTPPSPLARFPTGVNELGVDLLSIAGHKVYAPKGVGALFIRRGLSLEPLIHGAGHESGRRAGTESALLAVGLGKACVLAGDLAPMDRVRDLRAFFGKKYKNNSAIACLSMGIPFTDYRTHSMFPSSTGSVATYWGGWMALQPPPGQPVILAASNCRRSCKRWALRHRSAWAPSASVWAVARRRTKSKQWSTG